MRRVIFYLFHDREGIVDDYVPYKLRALRPFAEQIFVISHSPLDEANRAKLNEVADSVWVRDNTGYDVAAFRGAFERFGTDRLAEYDELILMNSTFFGPVYPFAEVFDRMDGLDVDFWGISAHKLVDPNPFANTTGVLPRHIQTHWLAVRRTMFTSIEWQTFWSTMPPLVTYDDVVLNYEARFTAYFERAGFSWVAAWSDAAYPTDHPIFESAPLLLADRCPILKRRQFFHDPMFLERNAIIGRRVLQMMEQTDYPIDLIWQNVARTAEPRNLYTNFSLLEIVSDDAQGWTPEPPPSVAVLAHMVHDHMADELLDAVCRIPVPFDLIVTTDRRGEEAARAALGRHLLADAEVRVVEDDPGGHMRALLVDCADVLRSGDYDLVCRVHTLPLADAQDTVNVTEILRHHLVDNTVSSRGYVTNLLRLFAEHPTLGMVFPPIINVGHATLGRSWFGYRPVAEVVAAETGITTLFDETTPIAPYNGVFWARPKTLRKLVDRPWTGGDYDDQRFGGQLSEAQERLLAYAVLDDGFHVRSVINEDWGSINYAFLEYKLQKLSSAMPAQTEEQLDFIRQVKREPGVILALKREVDRRYPKLGSAARPGYRVWRSGAARTKRR